MCRQSLVFSCRSNSCLSSSMVPSLLIFCVCVAASSSNVVTWVDHSHHSARSSDWYSCTSTCLSLHLVHYQGRNSGCRYYSNLRQCCFLLSSEVSSIKVVHSRGSCRHMFRGHLELVATPRVVQVEWMWCTRYSAMGFLAWIFCAKLLYCCCNFYFLFLIFILYFFPGLRRLASSLTNNSHFIFV